MDQFFKLTFLVFRKLKMASYSRHIRLFVIFNVAYVTLAIKSNQTPLGLHLSSFTVIIHPAVRYSVNQSHFHTLQYLLLITNL